MRLEGKVALITGGGTGIGLGIARAYVREGACVYITGRREEKLREACDEVGGTIGYVAADVTDKASMLRVAEKIREEQGHVDIVMCNAGIGGYVALADIGEAEFDRVMHTNVLGSYYTAQACLPLMGGGLHHHPKHVGHRVAGTPRLQPVHRGEERHEVVYPHVDGRAA